MRSILGFILTGVLISTIDAIEVNTPARWKRHVIDQSSRGADGVRLADVNHDGYPDIVTGWEEGGVTKICLHPGYPLVKKTWPNVTVGPALNVEDALFVDLDADGRMDVVSCCEGSQQSMIVHWGRSGPLLSQDAWETVEVIPSVQMFRWMFAIPLDVNMDGQVDLVAGGKGTDAMLGWWELPETPRNVSEWKWHPLRKVGWLMSLEAVDVNDDGKLDLLFTDRRGEGRGLHWLENPGQKGSDLTSRWREHHIGGFEQEVMFFSRGDLTGDSVKEIIVAIRPQMLLLFHQDSLGSNTWHQETLPIPLTYGTAKATAIADFNLDGQSEIIFSTENARSPKMALGMFVRSKTSSGQWDLQPISGVDGVKHDLVVPVDLDGDGDLDILTCEEVKNLGVIWYENPCH